MSFQRRMILALFFVAIFVMGTAFSVPKLFINRKLSRVGQDWQDLLKAFNAYGIDRCGMYYPPDTVERRKEDPRFPLTFELSPEFIKSRPLGYDHKPIEHWIPLTTPIAYAREIPRDPFRSGNFYGYSCWNGHDKVYSMAFLYSPGPDKKEDIPPGDLRKEIDTYLVSRGGGGDFLPVEYGVLKSMIIPYMYDPTNGVTSKGDLIWLLDRMSQVYGWGRHDVKAWTDAPLPDLPIYTPEDRSGIQGDWAVGDPLPPPRSMLETRHREKRVAIPDALFDAMRNTEYLQHAPDGGYRLDWDAMTGIQNRFGPSFADFFHTPRAFTAEEAGILERLTREDQKWWGPMDRFPKHFITSYESLEARQVYFFLPLFGKSQILLAADEAARDETENARKRIVRLEEALGKILDQKKMDRGIPDPYEQRVEQELSRLCLELKNNLKFVTVYDQFPR